MIQVSLVNGIFMRPIITFLLSAVFAAHGVFGCCWHHAHGEVALAATGTDGHDHACHEHESLGLHRHAAGCPTEGAAELPCNHDQPCNNQSCREPNCVYVRAEVESPPATPLGSLAAHLFAPQPVFTASHVVLGSSCDRSSCLDPQTPRHLLFQVLLI